MLDSPPPELIPSPIFQFINKDGHVVAEIQAPNDVEAQKSFRAFHLQSAKRLRLKIKQIPEFSFDVERQTIDLDDGMGII